MLSSSAPVSPRNLVAPPAMPLPPVFSFESPADLYRGVGFYIDSHDAVNQEIVVKLCGAMARTLRVDYRDFGAQDEAGLERLARAAAGAAWVVANVPDPSISDFAKIEVSARQISVTNQVGAVVADEPRLTTIVKSPEFQIETDNAATEIRRHFVSVGAASLDIVDAAQNAPAHEELCVENRDSVQRSATAASAASGFAPVLRVSLEPPSPRAAVMVSPSFAAAPPNTPRSVSRAASVDSAQLQNLLGFEDGDSDVESLSAAPIEQSESVLTPVVAVSDTPWSALHHDLDRWQERAEVLGRRYDEQGSSISQATPLDVLEDYSNIFSVLTTMTRKIAAGHLDIEETEAANPEQLAEVSTRTQRLCAELEDLANTCETELTRLDGMLTMARARRADATHDVPYIASLAQRLAEREAMMAWINGGLPVAAVVSPIQNRTAVQMQSSFDALQKRIERDLPVRRIAEANLHWQLVKVDEYERELVTSSEDQVQERDAVLAMARALQRKYPYAFEETFQGVCESYQFEIEYKLFSERLSRLRTAIRRAA